MVNPGAILDIGDGGFDAIHLGGVWVREKWQEISCGMELIVIAVIRAEEPVHTVDVFAPANQLTNETFGGFDRDGALIKFLHGCVDDFSGMKKSVIQVRRKE